MSTCRLINYAIRDTICSGARKAVVSVRQALFSFVMPLWFCAVILLSVSLPVHGTSVFAGSECSTDTFHNSNDVFVFTKTLLFPKASSVVLPDFAKNRATIDSIRRFFSVTDTRNLIDIKVIGSYSPEGKYAFNKKLAEVRARALGSLVREINHTVNPVLSINHPVVGQTNNYQSLRSAELQISYRSMESARNMLYLDTVRRQEGAGATGEADNVMAETCASPYLKLPPVDLNNCKSDNYIYDNNQSSPSSKRDRGCLGRRLLVSTNLLYDAALTPNIGAGISVGDRVTLLADWMYARWSNHNKRRYWRIYGGDVEVRYRIGARREGSPLGGHYIGAYGSLACYDFQAGLSHTGVLSDTYNYAVGVSYTYSLPISTHFNIDFSLGIGYLWGKYKKHTPIDDCDVWLSTHKLKWLGPTRAGVSLVWLIGNRVKNSRKGGSR